MLHVPPKGIGPISEPNRNDVLCGRGGRINAHEGNVQFRDIVNSHKKQYLAKSTKKLEKAHIAARIVEQVRTMDPPGRFLKEDPDGMWYDIGDAKAIKKAGQALREDAPDIRDGDSDDDEPNEEAKSNSSSTPPKTQQKRIDSSSPNKRPAPTSGRGAQQGSWGSNGSSSSGVPFPQQIPTNYAASATTFPATASVNSGTHSLSSGTPMMPPPPQPHPHHPGMFPPPNQMYRGVVSGTSALSRRAVEMMNFQQQQQALHQAHHQYHHPEEVAFGRVFAPTEISSGSTMSTISGISGFSSNVAGSRLGAASALSMGSSGMGPPVYPPGSGTHHSLRLSGTSQSLRFSALSAARAPPPPYQGTSQVSNVSDITNSFMTTSGLTRSPSFGDLSATVSVPMSDASFVALMAEDKEVRNILEEDREVGNILSNIPPPPPNSSGTSSTTGTSKTSASQNSGILFQGQHHLSSGISVASAGSGMQFSLAGSDHSLLHQRQPRADVKGSIGSNSDQEPHMQLMWDDRSMMSDVSESLLALDLASSAHAF
jgi:hypothetical protein